RRWASPSANAWVERVAQAVAQQVDGQDRDHDGQPRKDRDMRRDLEELATVGQHRAPFRRRWTNAESKEAERRDGQDSRAQPKAGDHKYGGDSVGQQMPNKNTDVTGSECSRGEREIELLEREDLPADDASEQRQREDADRDNHIRLADAEHGDN